jgi:diguanylate cyclase (GGDEF)-like protein
MREWIPSFLSWKRVIGPLMTAACGIVIALLFRYVTSAPIAAPIFLWAIVLSAYYGGLYSGLASSAIAIGFGAVFLSEPGQLFHFDHTNLVRFTVLSMVGPAIAVTVGLLHVREKRALRTERAARQQVESASRELEMLRSALEQVDYGVVLLDHELRAIFINRAFRAIWNLPDEKADSRPAFVALMYHGRDTKAYDVPPDELDRYVAQRTALVRRGDETPLDLRLANGEVLRFKCKALPSGGRMLSYASVTDLVRQAEELQMLATTDPLTGIYNRRRFFSLAEAEWARSQRYDRPLSMLMVDIDHFKSINDTFGHDAGDRVIARVAEVCRNAKRDTDILARVGGEEFAILLPETTARDAVLFGDRLRQILGEGRAADVRQLPKVTISIGVAQAGGSLTSIPKLMKAADGALYEAKRGGRDRVSIADPGGQDRQVA